MQWLWLLFLVTACSSSDTNDEPRLSKARQVFKCRKSGLNGAPWRECAPKISECDQYGCFERDQAFCFPVLFKNVDGSPDEQWTICTPSEKECQEWNDDRKTVVNKSLGPCVASRPDEFRELGPKK